MRNNKATLFLIHTGIRLEGLPPSHFWNNFIFRNKLTRFRISYNELNTDKETLRRRSWCYYGEAPAKSHLRAIWSDKRESRSSNSFLSPSANAPGGRRGPRSPFQPRSSGNPATFPGSAGSAGTCLWGTAAPPSPHPSPSRETSRFWEQPHQIPSLLPRVPALTRTSAATGGGRVTPRACPEVAPTSQPCLMTTASSGQEFLTGKGLSPPDHVLECIWDGR